MGRLILSVLTHSILLRPVGRPVAAAAVSYLLLEDGFFLLQESGDKVILE